MSKGVRSNLKVGRMASAETRPYSVMRVWGGGLAAPRALVASLYVGRNQ